MKVLTANRLIDGEVVWYGATEAWIELIDGARIARDKADDEALQAIGKAALAANLVVDVDLVDVELRDGRIVPTRLRERIRAAGPTTHLHHGKQARVDFAAAG
jgi:hypothetical protein